MHVRPAIARNGQLTQFISLCVSARLDCASYTCIYHTDPPDPGVKRENIESKTSSLPEIEETIAQGLSS